MPATLLPNASLRCAFPPYCTYGSSTTRFAFVPHPPLLLSICRLPQCSPQLSTSILRGIPCRNAPHLVCTQANSRNDAHINGQQSQHLELQPAESPTHELTDKDKKQQQETQFLSASATLSSVITPVLSNQPLNPTDASFKG